MVYITCFSSYHALLRLKKLTIESSDESINVIITIKLILSSNWLNKASPNRRTTTSLESVHLNMPLFISEVLLSSVALTCKSLNSREKKLNFV